MQLGPADLACRVERAKFADGTYVAQSTHTMSGEQDFEKMAKEAAAFIKNMAPDFTPKVALTLGSGCGDVANKIEPVCTIEYGKLPGFPVSSVQGHAGVLILGHLSGVPIVGLKGRVHYYEGMPLWE
jgi:hypothetical protein